jgi:hypothetical protein
VEAEEARRVGGRQRQELLGVQPQAPLLAPQRLRLTDAEADSRRRRGRWLLWVLMRLGTLASRSGPEEEEDN